MKKSILISVLVLVSIVSTFAQTMSTEPRSLDAVVAEIEKQQNVTAPDQVKVDKVTPALLEELGDAVMGVLIGNTDRHDAMDRMLGGDGSPQLTAFHTNLGEQYLVNGGLNGVRLGGPWGMGRFGMMYGWGNPGDKKTGKTVTIEGKLSFVDGYPAIESKDSTYLIGFPDFYYYAYTDGIKKGALLKVDGYEFAFGTGKRTPYVAVTKATINGKTYDFSGFGNGTMGGRGMMGGKGGGMMGGGGTRW